MTQAGLVWTLKIYMVSMLILIILHDTLKSDWYVALIWRRPITLAIYIHLPIRKKEDKTDCNNYRGISLLPTTYKSLSNILLSRLIPYAKEIIAEHQCGFRRNRLTIDLYSAFAKYLRKNGNKMKKSISSSYTSRKLMIQLGGRSYIRFSLSLVSLGNL